MNKRNTKILALTYKRRKDEMVDYLSVQRFKFTGKTVISIHTNNRYSLVTEKQLWDFKRRINERNLIAASFSSDYFIYDINDNLTKKIVSDYFNTEEHRKVINEIEKIDLTKMPLEELIAFKEKALMYKQKDNEIINSIINNENTTEYNIDKYIEQAEESYELKVKNLKEIKEIDLENFET